MTSDTGKARMGLQETFVTMHRLLRREISPAEAAAALGCEEDRVAPYPAFVLDHVRNVLTKNFPALASLLPADAWESLVREYFARYPPDHYEMNANAARFPEFLRAVAQEGNSGIGDFHLELATVEWMQWVVFSSPERIPRPGGLPGPVVNPTLAVLELSFPVAAYLSDWEEEAGKGFPAGVPAAPRKDQGMVFVFRHPATHEAVVQRARDPELFAFKVAYESMPLTRAAVEARISVREAEALLAVAGRAGFILL